MRCRAGGRSGVLARLRGGHREVGPPADPEESDDNRLAFDRPEQKTGWFRMGTECVFDFLLFWQHAAALAHD